jgi:hypothetical protein
MKGRCKMNLFKMIVFSVLTTSCGQGFFGDSGSEGSSSNEPTSESGKAKSLALDSKDDLPTCDDSSEKALAYVIDEKQFYVCNEGEWSEIDVNEDSLSDSEWKDPITGYVWMIGGKTTFGAIANACSGDYKTGSSDEVQAAAKHGLKSDDGIWVNGSSNKYMSGGQIRTESTATNAHSPVCVKK